MAGVGSLLQPWVKWVGMFPVMAGVELRRFHQGTIM